MADQNLKSPQRRVRVMWIAAIAVCVVALVIALLPRAADAEFVVLDRGNVRVDLVDEGRTRMHDVYLISAPVAGRVLRVDVEPGDSVVAAAVVARIAPAAAGFQDTRTDLQSRAGINAAAAGLRSANADLALAELEHARNRSLADARLIATAAADASRARLDVARAAQEAATAELARARSALLPAERATAGSIAVRAPVAGRVLHVPQKSEAVVAVGAPLVELGDPALVDVVAEFLSQDAVRIRPGQQAWIENWGGAPLAASVDRVEPVARTKVSALGVEEQRTNVILRISDKQAAAALGHDFRVDARVAVAEAVNALRAPLGALFRNGAQWSAYKVVDGRAVLTPVSVGLADGNYREVTAGLAAGDTVLLFPGSAISAGQRVKARGH